MRRFFNLDLARRNLHPIRIKILAAAVAVLTIYTFLNANLGTSGGAFRTLRQRIVRSGAYSKFDSAGVYCLRTGGFQRIIAGARVAKVVIPAVECNI